MIYQILKPAILVGAIQNWYYKNSDMACPFENYDWDTFECEHTCMILFPATKEYTFSSCICPCHRKTLNYEYVRKVVKFCLDRVISKNHNQLYITPFPYCAKNCSTLKYFGSCECENFCKHKFDKNGDPINHYAWCEIFLKEFFEKLNLKWEYYANIISSHGDKCYGYREEWEKNDIPFCHGVMLYLLSYVTPYSSEVRQTENGWVKPEQWVIKNYHRFIKELKQFI